jgi:hypothetical protein
MKIYLSKKLIYYRQKEKLKMRKIYFTILMAGVLLVFTAPLKAQIHVDLNVNLGSQPVWGPTGYDHVDNYYLPDIEVYYNVPTHRYYYNQGGRWVSSSSLPSRYRNYDLYNSHKVVMNESQPWRNNESNKNKYSSFKGSHDQQPIRDSKESKYFVNKNHPQHNTYVQQQKQVKNNPKVINKGNVGNNNKRNNGNGNGNKDNKQNNGNGKK